VTKAWLAAQRSGEPAALVTRLTGGAGRRLVVTSGAAIGALGDPSLEARADARAREFLSDALSVSATEQVDGVELFFEVTHAAPELVVFGAGQDAVPLARQAWMLGFDVTVVDSRAAYLRPDLFTGARLVLADFDTLPAAFALPRGAFVAVMNHHMDRDRQALRFAFDHDPAYIGVLGPRARFERLVAALQADGYVPTSALRERVHSPIGLAIGAETAEEVALAILAEIVARRRGFAGGFLSGSTGSIHRPADTRAVARS
jgi:xanthine dehydrogenase accessory factor